MLEPGVAPAVATRRALADIAPAGIGYGNTRIRESAAVARLRPGEFLWRL